IRAGYDPKLAVGVVAGSSVLGMLIPPSLLLILFAILTDSSIGELFLGGVGPGLLLTAAYCAYIMGLAILRPERFARVGAMAHDEVVDARKRLLLPVFLLAASVLGGIY